MKRIMLLACVVLAGCASGTAMQAECEIKYREFPAIFQCTYEAVAARNPAILKDARAKLYLLRGEQLALDVIEGRTSSLDAKVSWQRAYLEMKTARDQEVGAIFNSVARNLQTPAPSQMVNCTSTTLGASVYTTCR